MPAAKLKVAHSTPADSTAAVDAFMAALVHPHKAEIEALRKLMLSVDPSVREGVKWNAPRATLIKPAFFADQWLTRAR